MERAPLLRKVKQLVTCVVAFSSLAVVRIILLCHDGAGLLASVLDVDFGDFLDGATVISILRAVVLDRVVGLTHFEASVQVRLHEVLSAITCGDLLELRVLVHLVGHAYGVALWERDRDSEGATLCLVESLVEAERR